MTKNILAAMGLALTFLLPPVFAEDNTATDESSQEGVVLYVDINNDDAEKISDLLTGVGPAKAKAIVEYRMQNGPFIAPEDLLNVSGIGPATLEKNRDRIQVGPSE